MLKKRNIKDAFGQLRQRVHAANPYTRTLYGFNAISLVGGTVYGLYYGVFLYKHTFSLSVLAIDGLLGGFGVWLGYLLGVWVIKRYGYSRCIRLAFGLWTIIALATALITHHIADWYMLLAVIKALPSGMYAAVGDTIMLRNVAPRSRSGFLQLNLALEFVASIVLPSAVGALITVTGGYMWAFAVAALIYASSFALRCQLPKPTVVLRFNGMVELFKRPMYPMHAFNQTTSAGFNQMNAFAITILPFLLLGNEFSMGVIASVSALVAAIVSLGMRRLRSSRHELKLGYGAHATKFVMGSLFIALWTTPAMAVWQVVGKVLTPLHDPVQQSFDIHNDSLILGKDAAERALQINVVNNTLKLLGTTVAFGGFILVTRANPGAQRTVLEGLIVVYGLWRMVSLTLSAWLNRFAQRFQGRGRIRWMLRDKLTALSFRLYAYKQALSLPSVVRNQ